MLDLQRDMKAKKVDHPVKSTKGGPGRKDVSDGLAGAFYDCIEDEDCLHHEVVDENGGTWGVVQEFAQHAGISGNVDTPLPMPQAPMIPGDHLPPAGVAVPATAKPGPHQPHAQPLPGMRPKLVAGVDASHLEHGL